MKNIVICSDGTGNEYGENNTNVVETYAICQRSKAQVVFYDPGVGTGGWEYLEGKPDDESLKSLSDKATGEGLQRNVNDAYGFLMETYEEGDLVYLFGFSRGAFPTSAVGMTSVDFPISRFTGCSKKLKLADCRSIRLLSTYVNPIRMTNSTTRSRGCGRYADATFVRYHRARTCTRAYSSGREDVPTTTIRESC